MVIIPKVSDWRWLNSKDETIWYDNFRIYRQKVQGDWSDVFAKVEKDCQELIKNISDLRKLNLRFFQKFLSISFEIPLSLEIINFDFFNNISSLAIAFLNSLC